MKIAIIGTGYVGLPTGVGFAELGHQVICVDNDNEKIADLKASRITLFESGLEELLKKNITNGTLRFTTDMKSGIDGAELIIIAVGTPPHPVTKEADMKYVRAAVEELAQYLADYTVVAIKSTVPVGTGDDMEAIIKTKNPKADFDVVSIPEFLREGFAFYDFSHPDRVVVGTDSDRAIQCIHDLYSVFSPKPNILFVERRSSELIKYASNAFLAIKIHYINEIADFCEKTGANVYEVAQGVGLDSRIGNKFLNPGPGYGGSCFPKDTNALVRMARKKQVNLSLVEAAIVGNDRRKAQMAQKILEMVKDIPKPRIAIWGLAFKGGTDDARESPALEIVKYLISHGADIVAYDPKAMNTTRIALGDAIQYAESAVAAADGADILAVLTEWQEFKTVPLESLNMRSKRIVDLRHIVNEKSAMTNGFMYKGIGS